MDDGQYPASFLADKMPTMYGWEMIKTISPAAGTLILVYFLSFLCLKGWFRRRARRQAAPTHIRGTRIVTPPELSGTIGNRNADCIILNCIYNNQRGAEKECQIPIPPEIQNQHFISVGRSRTGKTNLQNQILEQLRARNAKVVIYDRKGSYLRTFYDESSDAILNPVDARGAGWTLFNDVKDEPDIDTVAASIIPAENGGADPFWNNAAREMLSAILHCLAQRKTTTNKDLWQLLSVDTPALAAMLTNVKGAEAALKYLANPSERLAQSIISVMMSHVRGFAYMAAKDGPFTLSDWMGDKNSGWLFLTSQDKVHAALKPILTLTLDMLISKLFALNESHLRRIFFIFDEFASLQPLQKIEQLVSEGGGFGASVSISTQSISQIVKTYSRDGAETILNSLATGFFFGIKSPVSAKYISDRIGEGEYYEASFGKTWGPQDFRDGESFKTDKRREAAVSPSQLMALPPLAAYVEIANYGIALVKFRYKGYESRHPEFLLRPGLELSKIASKQEDLENEEYTVKGLGRAEMKEADIGVPFEDEEIEL
jgi:type IV secretory pathway TraG/TraD family ATPase VirD4